MPSDDPTAVEASVPELQRRLVFSLLRPAVRLCRFFRLPLKTLEDLCRLAYFEELRHRGDTPQAEIARTFGKSLRTVGTLERQYRTNFFAPERELEFARRVESVFEHGSRTTAEVEAALADDADATADEIERAVEGLLSAGRIVVEARDGDCPRYALDRRFISLVQSDLEARVDGLNHQLDVIAAAVRSRFLAPRRRAIARSLAFVAHPDDVEALGEALVRALRDRCSDAEETALEAGGYERYGVTLALAPMEKE